MNPDGSRAFYIFQAVVDKERFVGANIQFLQRMFVDCSHGFDQVQLTGPGEVMEAVEPGEVLSHVGEQFFAHVGQDGNLHSGSANTVHPFQHDGIDGRP